MSADLLRRAASLMRERAEAATPGPWLVEDWPALAGRWQVYDNADPEGIGETVGVDMVQPDAEHIASWHPDVALIVARWLDSAANTYGPEPDADEYTEFIEALAVARAYLGESA